jgi:non-specific protein-tyrosine kinase
MQPTYQATTSVLVGQSLQAPDLSKQDLEASQQLAQTYADLVRRQPVLSGAADVLGLNTSWQTLRDQVRVDLAPDNGTLIVVTVEAGSSDEAVRIAGAIADQLVGLSPSETGRADAAEIQDFVSSRLATLQTDIRRAQRRIDTLETELAVARTEQREGDLRLEIEGQERLAIAWLENYSSLLGFLSPEQSPNSLQVLEEASAKAEPVRPDKVLNTAMAAVAGFLLAFGIVYVLESRVRGGPAGLAPTDQIDDPGTPTAREPVGEKAIQTIPSSYGQGRSTSHEASWLIPEESGVVERVVSHE